MTTKQVTHILGNGEEQDYIRITADPGKALTNDNGATTWNCVDVLSVDGWTEIDLPPDPDEDATAEDYEAALNRLGVET